MKKKAQLYFKLLIKVLLSKIPKDNNIWITGSNIKFPNGKETPFFFDNNKYLYIYLIEYTNKEVYWLTEDMKIYNKLKQKGMPVLYKYSYKGLLKAIRAKYYFSNYGIGQITNTLGGGAISINLWHGTPLKKIGYDIVKYSKKNREIKNKLKIDCKEYLLTTSKYIEQKCFYTAFKLKKNNYLSFGYPRTDIFSKSKKELKKFIEKYSPELIKVVKNIETYETCVIYMPTWRDDNPNYLEKAAFDYKKLNKELKNKNILMLFKLHPLTKTKIINMSNIKTIENNIDIYPILPFTNYLITDYSSIYFDYLLLNKEIIFFPFDEKDYISKRELYFNYHKVTPGRKVYSFNELIKSLNELENLDYKDEREKLKKLIINNYNYNSSEKIVDFFSKNKRENE